MKLCYWKKADEVPNFGDVLNPYIFEKLLPGTFDDDANTIFVGIGTLLEKGMGEALNIPAPLLANDEPLSKWIVVFGSGAGYYDPPTMDSRWKIYAVRGPLTADLLGLDPKCAVADPAILIRRLYQGSASKKHKFSLMPHHSNAGPVLESICNEIGIHYINPLSPVPGILDAIAGSETLLTEALHGAIVADALRTPWVPIRTTPSIFSFKWEDWCKSINLEYKPVTTSNILSQIWVNTPNPSFMGILKQKIKLTIAEKNLKGIALSAKPLLSKDDVIEGLTQELEHRLDLFREDAAKDLFS